MPLKRIVNFIKIINYETRGCNNNLDILVFLTSALIASKGTKVFEVDINKNVVETINKGKIHIIEPDLEDEVEKRVDSERYTHH